MNPNGCSVRSFGARGFGKAAIDLFKDGPVGIVNVEVSRKSVENWPEAFLRCDVIKAGYLLVGEWNSAKREW